VDPLTQLIELPEAARAARGLTDTPREIHQQPKTWLKTLERMQAVRSSVANVCEDAGKRFSQVILAGAGSSDYVGRALAGLLQQHWGCPVRSIPSTDLLTSLAEFILPDGICLLISFSRSGESSEGIALLDLAMQRYPEQIRHVVITCNAAGDMARMPGVLPIVLDDAVNDRGLAMTSSFTNMLIAGEYLAYYNQEPTCATLVNDLATMGKNLLPNAAELTAKLAKRGFRRVCFLGSGALQAAAQESALKVLELNAGNIATLAESFLGLRHGPMSFLNRQTLVCAYLSGDEPRSLYELDVLDEMRSKRLAGELLVVAPRNSDRIRAAAGHVIDLQAPQGFPDLMRPAVDVIVGQLLALFLSIENGVRPDTPSTGAISRVVSHVKIYTPAATSRNGQGRKL
jgi:tagatose-6-phosphate ketose/aldose isomerase